MRGLEAGTIELDAIAVEAMETCIQCRGCETACPSGVPFGSLMVETRRAIATGPRRRRSSLLRLAFRGLAIGWLVRGVSRLAAVAQRLGLVPSRRLGLPRRLPLREAPLVATGSDVWLFTGCVMDAWQRSVHADALATVTATGRGVALTDPPGGCCGALAEHSGLTDLAHRQAVSTMASMPGEAPILVDAAGCGAMLKDYGHLLGTAEAERFAARVLDISEWLADHLDELPATRPGWQPPSVVVQDPCHLRHVQRAHLPVRTVLSRCASVVELDDDGMCCGAGGAFAVTQPGLADEVRERKLAAIARAAAPLVASANPGCSIHLEWAGLDVRHPVSIVADSIGLASGASRGR
jgi:glycolate oxidase iron-sulfur subunit